MGLLNSRTLHILQYNHYSSKTYNVPLTYTYLPINIIGYEILFR